MDIEKLQTCADVLGQMSTNLTALPTDTADALKAGIFCQMAQSYVLEFAKHMLDGMEPYDALVSTARGDLVIPEEKTILFRVLSAKPQS